MAKARRKAKSARRKVSVRKPTRKAVKKASRKVVRRPAAAAKPSMQLKGQANLLVSYDPYHKGTAELELKEVLKQIGEKPQFAATDSEGLFKAAVSDARKATAKIRELCRKNPGLFTATHHYTPIDKWCRSEVGEMQKLIKAAAAGISGRDKWKLGLNKRYWDKLEGPQLVVKLTDVIDKGNVDLDNPDKVVQVEIIGKEAGVSLLTPKDVFDVAREREA